MEMPLIRILLIQSHCPHCLLYKGVVEEINMKLQPSKRIKIIDVAEMWTYGVELEPIVNQIDIKGTPTLYLGGKNPIAIEGVSTRSYLKGFLTSYFQKLGEI